MEDLKNLIRRANLLIALFAACLIGFVCILYNAQVVHGSDYLAQSNTQVTTTKTVETSRGIVTDCNGKVLASNQETYTVTFSSKDIPTEPERSQKQSVALAALRLIRLCQDYGVEWTDSLPLSATEPFAYTISSTGGTLRGWFQNYLADRKWSDTEIKSSTAFPLMSESLRESLKTSERPLSANRLLALMREDFDIPEEFTNEEARLVCGVLYELALRVLPQGMTVNIPYVFEIGRAHV